jgi:hypothetical protein
VIELFPFGFFIPTYFGDLARKSGLLHYSWQENFNNTYHKKNFNKRVECRKILTTYFKNILNRYVYNNNNKKSNNNNKNNKNNYLKFNNEKIENINDILFNSNSNDNNNNYNNNNNNNNLNNNNIDENEEEDEDNDYILKNSTDIFKYSKSSVFIENNNIFEPFLLETMDTNDLLKKCFFNGVCRSCARGADGVEINIEKLKIILEQSLIDRRQCILDNPLYNIINENKNNNFNFNNNNNKNNFEKVDDNVDSNDIKNEIDGFNIKKNKEKKNEKNEKKSSKNNNNIFKKYSNVFDPY